MSGNNLSKVSQIEVAISVLKQALKHFNQHDYSSAWIMVAVVGQMLEDLQIDFDWHFELAL